MSEDLELKSEPEAPKLLTQAEADLLEHWDIVRKLSEKELMCHELRLARLSDQQQILELMIKNLEVDRLKIAEERKAVVERRLGEKRKYDETVVNPIRERLGITGSFGFKPETLEVVPG